MSEKVYNVVAIRNVPGMARSEIVAGWTGTAWTTDPDQAKNYWTYSYAERALESLHQSGFHRAFDDVIVVEQEYREPMERKRWNPGRSLQGYSQQDSLKIINEVRSAIANLDMDDRNPAIRAALTIGWVEGEELMGQPMAKKRWGEYAPGDAREVLESMADEMAQMDPDQRSDIVTLGLGIIARGIESIKRELPIPDMEVLTALATKDFVHEFGRDPKLGWWNDPISDKGRPSEDEGE